MVDKQFNYPVNPDDLMSQFQSISYDVGGYPAIYVIVHNWENVPLLTKTAIIAELTAKGYVEA